MMTSKSVTWHPAVPIRPIDNLISSDTIRLKRFVPSYERESHINMAQIISHDYARIWQQDRKQWEHMLVTTTTKRSNVLLLRKVVNANLRRKGECPEKYRSKAEFRPKLNLLRTRGKSRSRNTKSNDCAGGFST